MPEKVSIDVLHKAIEFAELQDDDTLKALYKQVAGELAFRRAVAPGPERGHVLVQGVKDNVGGPAEIGGYIMDVCLSSGIDCGKALERFDLTAPGSGILTKFPAVPNEAVSFVGQSVSGTLLFYDVYYTMLVNQALDLDRALDTLDGLEKLPLGEIWKDAVVEARNDVVATASPDRWTAYAAAIDQSRDDVLQFAGIQTVQGLVQAAAKNQLLYHAGIAGQKALVSAGGTTAGAGGIAAAGPTAFVASVWFASEVYRSVEEQEEQLGTAALAAFINAAFSAPAFIEKEFSDPAERANLQEAMAYAKYVAYDNLYKAEEGWLNSLSALLKLYAADRQQFLEEMETGRERARDELMVLLSPESVEVDPVALTLATGETKGLRARATARSGRVADHSGFEWSSDAPGIATVSQNGVVTGVALGEAVIAVRAGDAEASARVKVTAAAKPSPAATKEPASARVFVSISAGYAHTCGVRENGEVVCWGYDNHGVATPPAGKFASVSAGSRHTCGVRENGEAVCWGENHDGKATPPGGKFASVSVGADTRFVYTCGVRENGEVVCWGYDTVYMERGLPTPPAGEFASVSVGKSHICGLREGGEAVCWGDDKYGEANPPDGKFASVSAGRAHTCGLRESGEAVCWGNDEDGEATPPAGKFASVSAGRGYTCGVRESGEAICWGKRSFGKATPPGGKFTSVSAGSTHTCGVRADGSVTCWGLNGFGETMSLDGGRKFVSLSAGRFHTCGVREDGSIACWGWPAFATPPDGEFASVIVGHTHSCGLRTDGTVACWGEDRDGQTKPPAGKFISISSGIESYRDSDTSANDGYTCGVRTDGSVICWGADRGRATPPGGEFTAISVGGSRSDGAQFCGVRTDGSVACWGNNEDGKATPPDGEFTSVSAGGDHTCGLRESGEAVCWGSGYSGQDTPPEGKFASISAGFLGACGVKADGSIACWGPGYSDLPTPDGKFVSVSVNIDNSTTCGVRTDGSVYCWHQQTGLPFINIPVE